MSATHITNMVTPSASGQANRQGVLHLTFLGCRRGPPEAANNANSVRPRPHTLCGRYATGPCPPERA